MSGSGSCAVLWPRVGQGALYTLWSHHICEWHFRNNPKVRDRVFFGLIGVALLHGTFLLSSSFDEGSE